jgi:hypothetical protein
MENNGEDESKYLGLSSYLWTFVEVLFVAFGRDAA